jgi:hypothetical protein
MRRTSFNEWLTLKGDNSGLKTTDNNLDLVTIDDDDGLATNQLSQFVERVMGILNNFSEDKKEVLVDKFIHDLKARLRD